MILLMSVLAAGSGGVAVRSITVIRDGSLYALERWYAVDVPKIPAPMIKIDGSSLGCWVDMVNAEMK